MGNSIDHPTRGKLVCKIWDNGGMTLDRYTVIFKGERADHGSLFWPYLAASENPSHPLGFGQYGEFTSWDHAKGGKHLGKRVSFSDVPKDVQQFIMHLI